MTRARVMSEICSVDAATAARWQALADDIDIRSGAGDGRLCVRVRELSREAQAAALRLDPVADREEHAELIALLDDETPVVCVATRSHVSDKLLSNVQEVRARGAQVIAAAEVTRRP